MTFVLAISVPAGVLLTITSHDRACWCRTCSATRHCAQASASSRSAVAFGLGSALGPPRLAPRVAPRWLIDRAAGCVFVLAAMLYGSTLTRHIPYFPDLFMPIVVGGFGHWRGRCGSCRCCAVAEVGPAGDRPGLGDHVDGAESRRARWCSSSFRPCRPRAPSTCMAQRGPVKNMTPAQLDALGKGLYLLTACGSRGIAVIVGIAAFLDRLLLAFSIATSPAHPRGSRGGRAVMDDDARPKRDSRSSDAVSTPRAGA